MTLKNKNPWKLLSIGLLGVIAIGLLTPVDAKPPANQDDADMILQLLLDEVFGLEAISNDIGTVQSSVDAIDTSGLATQTSVDAIMNVLCTTALSDLSEKDLSGCDLSGKDLSSKDLTGADLSGADLTGTTLTDANLFETNLTGADITDATLTGSTMLNVDLTGATLGAFYIDETFDWIQCDLDCQDTGGENHAQNTCDGDESDVPIALLEASAPTIYPSSNTKNYYLDDGVPTIDMSISSPTLMTILCENTTP